MDDPDAIAAAYMDALSELDANIYDYVPSSPNIPAIVVNLEDLEYDSDFEDGCEGTVTLTIFGPTVATANGMSVVTKFLASTGASSIREAIKLNNTLNGVVSSCKITKMRARGTRTLGDQGTQYFTAQLVSEFYA